MARRCLYCIAWQPWYFDVATQLEPVFTLIDKFKRVHHDNHVLPRDTVHGQPSGMDQCVPNTRAHGVSFEVRILAPDVPRAEVCISMLLQMIC
jgi:hypothetical protein